LTDQSKIQTTNNSNKIGVFTLVMISAALIVSVRNLPMLAETGFHMIFYGLIAVLAFLLPVALVSAELATGWPKQGGVYAWVGEAFGERWGFVAIWLQWIQMVFGMVTVLAFIAGSLAFLIDQSLASNGMFIFAVVFVVYWGATLLNFRGMKMSGIISSVCLIAGVLIPGTLIIALGAISLLKGDSSEMSFAFTTENLFPNFNSFQNIALLSGIIFIFSGMEVSAAHANEVQNPQRNYPKAIFFAALLMVFLNIVGAISVGIVVPRDEINLAAGVMEAFKAFFDKFNLLWLLPIMAGLTAFGAMGQVSTWILGPVKGLLSTAENGDLPPMFQKVNKNGIPVRLLVVQASLVTFFGLLFAVIPGVNEAFIMLLNVLIMLYCCMYILMFLAVLRLRYSEPDVKRAYTIPFGVVGVWFIAGLGILASVFVLFIGFFPPSQLKIESAGIYRIFIASCLIGMLALPFIIYALKKPTWKKEVQNVNG